MNMTTKSDQATVDDDQYVVCANQRYDVDVMMFGAVAATLKTLNLAGKFGLRHGPPVPGYDCTLGLLPC